MLFGLRLHSVSMWLDQSRFFSLLVLVTPLHQVSMLLLCFTNFSPFCHKFTDFYSVHFNTHTVRNAALKKVKKRRKGRWRREVIVFMLCQGKRGWHTATDERWQKKLRKVGGDLHLLKPAGEILHILIYLITSWVPGGNIFIIFSLDFSLFYSCHVFYQRY